MTAELRICRASAPLAFSRAQVGALDLKRLPQILLSGKLSASLSSKFDQDHEHDQDQEEDRR
jgi:hypothetical protein